MSYQAEPLRYDTMQYARVGASGLKLPRISLGLWHNFGDIDDMDAARAMLRTAFDQGITHFDLANNYGPPAGTAERNFGKILAEDFSAYRDELIISSKAGHHMWAGPYGEWGSRKYMLASLDQSLARMGIEYVDIFYSHRYDPETPLEETMGALDTAVRSGRALYAGISSYGPDETREAARILKDLGTPCLIHQPSYSLFNRWIETGLTDVLREEKIGSIVFSPLAQGQLSDKYLNQVPSGSRANSQSVFLQPDTVQKNLPKVRALNEIAQKRGQSLAQMALAWVLRDPVVTSALIGASSSEQILENVAALDAAPFTAEELKAIDRACNG
ncbi:MAG: L-glyceraldehyde 3-phosphate reductase [Verrucomicrobia bacterium]|nr:L-glyceraldehyde 3-phosphate reductase [Verrucomicrobiota bacterium]